jgi:hypothetical protein
MEGRVIAAIIRVVVPTGFSAKARITRSSPCTAALKNAVIKLMARVFAPIRAKSTVPSLDAIPPSWIAAFSVRPPDTRLNSPSRVAFSMSSEVMRRISNGRVATFHAFRVTPWTSVRVSSCI